MPFVVGEGRGCCRIVTFPIHEARQRGSAIVGIFHDDVARNAVADRIVPMDRP